jgi:hypothetical protein
VGDSRIAPECLVCFGSIDRTRFGEDKGVGGNAQRPRDFRHALSVSAVDQNQQLTIARQHRGDD